MATTGVFYCGDTDKLFTSWVNGAPHTGTPSDGSNVQVVQDEGTPATRDIILVYTGTTPKWANPGPMALPSCSFLIATGGYFESYDYNTASAKSASEFITASAGTIVQACRITAGGSNNANIWQNTAIIRDNSGWIGIHIKLISSVLYAIGYSYDSGSDVTAAIPIAYDTDYIFQLRHGGGTLTLTVISGAGGSSVTTESVAAGDTGNLFDKLLIMQGSSNLSGNMGELRFDNTDLGLTNTPRTEMTASWLPTSGVPVLATSAMMLLFRV